MKLAPLVRVKAVESLPGFWVRIQFSNGAQRAVDLEPYLRGPIFEPIRHDLATFRSMKIEDGTIAWENGADIDPDVLYYGLKPAWTERISPRPARAAEMAGATVSQIREADGVQYDLTQEADTVTS